MIVKSLYYMEDDNVFIDDDGYVVCDIFRYFSPNMLMLFREKRGTFYLPYKPSDEVVYELVFPLHEDDECQF